MTMLIGGVLFVSDLLLSGVVQCFFMFFYNNVLLLGILVHAINKMPIVLLH